MLERWGFLMGGVGWVFLERGDGTGGRSSSRGGVLGVLLACGVVYRGEGSLRCTRYSVRRLERERKVWGGGGDERTAG